jgi:hypothetical protein
VTWTMKAWWRASLLSLGLAACGPSDKVASDSGETARTLPQVELPTPTLRRLTQVQYGRAIHTVLGADLLLPTSLEPDEPSDGLVAIGAAITTISPRGVEQYEDAAFNLAAQALETPERRESLVPCTPQSTYGDACAERFYADVGLRLWRRPLTAEELDRLVGIAMAAYTALGDFYLGLEYGLAALLQSPNFLFRVELGETVDDGSRWFTNYEMASRLSFFLWDTIPDVALLDAAKAGVLTEDEGLLAQVDRMVADPQYEQGLRAFFTDMLALHDLDGLNKDPTIFTHMSPEVGPAAREETLLGILHLVRTEDGDYRDLLTTQTTFMDKRLASIYAVRAPAREGFGQIELSEDAGRRGLLGQVSFLAGQSHAVSSSATLRGKYVRERLLCDLIPPPPSNLNTSIPAATESAVTLRERVAVHLEDPYCASCHQLTDPIGLGFENFDGLGHWRDREQGAVIDASGDLDEVGFADSWTLAQALRDHPDLPGCLVETMLEYGAGHSLTDGEDDALAYHTIGFVASGHRVSWLLSDIAMSPAFRRAGEIR